MEWVHPLYLYGVDRRCYMICDKIVRDKPIVEGEGPLVYAMDPLYKGWTHCINGMDPLYNGSSPYTMDPLYNEWTHCIRTGPIV